MHDKEKMIRNFVIFILLIALTFVLIFKNYDYQSTIEIIHNTDKKFIFLAILVMFLNITFESVNIKYILKTLGNEISLFKMISYTFVGFFYSGITPAAGGGQPMEIYYMRKDKIPVTSSTIALLLETCSFHIVTILFGVIGVIYNYDLTKNGFIYIFIVGLALKAMLLAIMLICLFSKKLSDVLVKLFLKILKIINYSKLEEAKTGVNKALEEYHKSARHIKKHKGILLKSTLIVTIQVIMYYTVSYFVYRSFGLNDYGYFKLITLQALLFVSVASLPLPGAVGISESAFLKLYITIFGVANLAGATIMTRGVNFYLFMIISMFVVISKMLKIKEKNN